MLVSKNCINKEEYKYKCDRCGLIMPTTQRKIISVGDYLTSPKKRWDLCPKCFRSLVKGIEKQNEVIK